MAFGSLLYLFYIFLIIISSPIWLAIIVYIIFSKRINKKLWVWLLTLAGFILGIILIIIFFVILSTIPEDQFYTGFG